jgi:membrane protease YdiL (CAAX protease family)
MQYEKPQAWMLAIFLMSAVGNGFFEELLWRGVYLELFPGNLLLGAIWPSVWFALWHYAPVSITADGNVLGMIIGSGIMGLYLSFLARRTGSIWWTILMHVIGGFIMVS